MDELWGINVSTVLMVVFFNESGLIGSYDKGWVLTGDAGSVTGCLVSGSEGGFWEMDFLVVDEEKPGLLNSFFCTREE
jgi:hypothetical protein